MSALPKPKLSADEYLARERVANHKSEYYFGEAFAMAGASFEHNQIEQNIARILGNQLLERPCQVIGSNLRVECSPGQGYSYPDAVVVCGKPQFRAGTFDVLLNPQLLIEILSPTTEAFDRGAKAALYRAMPTLTDYVLIAQTEPRVEHFHREEAGYWRFTESAGLDAILSLPSIACELPLRGVYAKVEFTKASNH